MRDLFTIGRGLLNPTVVFLALFSYAFAQDTVVDIHIPSKPLADALIDLAVQARLSISVSGIDFHGARSRAIDGAFSRSDALLRLLGASEFDFAFLDSSTVQIRLRAKAANGTSAPANGIEDVVVTATKRAAIVQNLPYSIAVVSGDRLADVGVASTHGLTSQFAGLTSTNLGPGEDKLFVRGLTDSVLPGLSESVVGEYLDEARIVDDAPDPDLQLVDIDRVEVLRGPQGSLYGAGSLTGLMRIVTRKPVYDEFQATAATIISTTDDGGLSTDFQGMVNAPIIPDRLAARFVAYQRADAGYVDDVRLGGSDTNRTSVEGGRLVVGMLPDAAWTVLANLGLQNTRSRDSQYYIQELGAYNRDNYLQEPHEDHFLETGITAKGALGWADLVSNTSYVDRSYNTRFDATPAWTSLTGFPVGPSPFDFARTIDSFSHETRLASAEDSAWQWLLGAFLDHRDEDFASSLRGPDTALTDIVARSETREDRLDEAALFGEVSYVFAPGLSLTTGARAFVARHAVSAASAGLLVGAPATFNGSNRQTGVAPKFVLKYELNPDATLYAQFSEGYRLGGINVDGPAGATGEKESTFDSDNLRNYEIGAKLSLLDGRLTANAAAYFEDWTNVQADEIAPDGAFYILNAGSVRDPGLELDFGLEPLQNLDLQGNVFWNDASLSRGNALPASGDNGLPGAPSASAAFSAEYRVSLDAQTTVFVLLNDAYVGSSHLGFSETTPSMGNYNIASIRAGVARGPWQMTLFVDNLTADHANTFAFGNPFNPEKQITPPQPRTLGLSLSWTD